MNSIFRVRKNAWKFANLNFWPNPELNSPGPNKSTQQSQHGLCQDTCRATQQSSLAPGKLPAWKADSKPHPRQSLEKIPCLIYHVGTIVAIWRWLTLLMRYAYILGHASVYRWICTNNYFWPCVYDTRMPTFHWRTNNTQSQSIPYQIPSLCFANRLVSSIWRTSAMSVRPDPLLVQWCTVSVGTRDSTFLCFGTDQTLFYSGAPLV